MKNKVAAFTILLVFALLVILPAPVDADVAPPPIPLVGGLGTFQYQNTNVQMAAERVEMELTSFQKDEEENAIHKGVTVNAWFVMENDSSQAETMQVVFPLDDMNRCFVAGSLGGFKSYSHAYFTPSSFEAQINGEPVETTTIATEHPWKAKSPACQYSNPTMSWAAFNVTFPAKEQVLIRISYLLDLGSGEGSDAVFNVAYTLETGAAWKGPIGEATIVFRFPYVVDNFIMPGTTPGYQIMQNEIYWRYENFEPSSQDNIDVAFIHPATWAKITDSRRRIKDNPKDDAAWAQLAKSYSNIAHYHGPNIRSKEYDQRTFDTYLDGLKINPNSAILNAGYASMYVDACCYYFQITASDLKIIQPYVETALKSDPANQKALELLGRLQMQYPEIAITVGPTFTPDLSATPTRTQTPTVAGKLFRSRTPTVTITPYNTFTPQPTRTRTVTLTATDVLTNPPPTATETPKFVSTAVQGEQGGNRLKIGLGFVIVGGILALAPLWWRLIRKRQS